jgi:hypothetical protein
MLMAAASAAMIPLVRAEFRICGGLGEQKGCCFSGGRAGAIASCNLQLGHEICPKATLKTEDLITGCELASDTLICLHEASKQPRRIIRINSGSGARTILFDPNPSFRRLQMGGVKRLRWKNSIGIECFGDLVLPQKHSNQSKIPLIVVQYLTRGFLRGGVGDEYPIFHSLNRLCSPKPAETCRLLYDDQGWLDSNSAGRKNHQSTRLE